MRVWNWWTPHFEWGHIHIPDKPPPGKNLFEMKLLRISEWARRVSDHWFPIGTRVETKVVVESSNVMLLHFCLPPLLSYLHIGPAAHADAGLMQITCSNFNAMKCRHVEIKKNENTLSKDMIPSVCKRVGKAEEQSSSEKCSSVHPRGQWLRDTSAAWRTLDLTTPWQNILLA